MIEYSEKDEIIEEDNSVNNVFSDCKIWWPMECACLFPGVLWQLSGIVQAVLSSLYGTVFIKEINFVLSGYIILYRYKSL